MRAPRLGGVVTGAAVVLLAAAIAGGATSIASAEPRTAGAAAAKPKWKVIPGARFDLDRLNVDVFGWASGRAWIGFVYGNGPLKLTSVRPAGRGLGAFTRNQSLRVRFAGPIVGSKLTFQTPSLSAVDSRLRMVPLLANGELGTPEDVAVRPEPSVLGLDFLGVSAGARLADREVWAFIGGVNVNIHVTRHNLLVCCDAGGTVVDLTRFIDRKHLASVRLGIDDRRRLWIAWKDPRSVQIAELDSATLLPRTKPVAVPGGSVERFELPCAAVCRVVAQRVGDRERVEIFSWAPGERSRTKLVSSASLLAADYRLGALEVAYSSNTSKVQVIRANARGARPRVVGSLLVPIPLFGWSPLGYDATFVPGGVVAVVMWENIANSNGNTRVTAAYVPAR
jgi:hypothetical protein